ncbi:LysR family transcriptional regulator [Luteibacter rhizovicinus]|uniref:LysR family transcriptional regulator n=1 Tax=Luteibacter rhizovicinus TaxID=242606 RepID=A0A4R3YYI4_9GAMM|nr:LysR family transcriptional regulator [Luteibacter rhizovicinus]TCV96423.1 LysR family transcriptional regulator [Luteibacter rhizovicinus]
MEFRQLQLFVAVAEELHFSRAAERVRMAQPPFSQQIRKLEMELGTQLLVRSSRRVTLTPAGTHLLEQARALLAKRAEVVAFVQRVAEGEAGLLRVGFGASSAFGVLPGIVQRFRARHPHVVLRLDDRDALDIGAALVNGDLDIAIVRAPFQHVGVDVELLSRERFVLAVPAGHALAKKKRVTLTALAAEPFILFPRHVAPSLHDTITSLCIEAGFSPHIVHEASSWPSVISLVKAGLGITIAPDSARAVLPGGVVFKALPDIPERAELLLAYPRQALSPVAAHFCAAARMRNR